MEPPVREYAYLVDAANIIISVGPDWVAFARENGLPELTPAAVTGRALLDFVVDKETRHLYELLLQKARRTGREIAVPFRCDSPDVRRFMELWMRPLPRGEVELKGLLLREERRPSVQLLAPSVERSRQHLTICGWCKRVHTAGQWLEVENAVAQLKLFDPGPLPQLTHGICPDCASSVLALLEDS